MRRATILAVVLTAAPAASADEPAWPLTRAERTGYAETSTLDDATAFLAALRDRGAPVDVTTIGRTAGGLPLVLAIAGREGARTPAGARAGGKVVVYVQANIHGGEVEGKEAALMLLRNVAADRDGAGALLDRLVLLVCPVFNADGNEALGDGPALRPSQDGPARVGRRPNAAGIDLNRDAIKAEAPETRAVLESVHRAWEPDVVLDLHTTNGTRHGYMLTYSPPLHPDTDPTLRALARDEVLPAVRDRLRRERGWRTFDYGNVEARDGRRAWYTFGHEGRYVTNYAGLRNRIGILSEAASFQPFRTRVEVTLGFVRAVLDEVARRAGRVRERTAAADLALSGERAPASLGVRFAFEPRPEPEPIPLEVLPDGASPDRRKAPDPARLVETTLPVLDRFRASRSAAVPAAYILTREAGRTVDLLRRHGVIVERLERPWKGEAQVFEVVERVTSDQAFQGGRLSRLEGEFATRPVEAAAGSFLIRTAQPLGRLAFHLLEPESLDGVAAWGLLDDLIAAPGRFPIIKVFSPLDVETGAVP